MKVFANLPTLYEIVKPKKWMFISLIFLATVLEMTKLAENYLIKFFFEGVETSQPINTILIYYGSLALIVAVLMYTFYKTLNVLEMFLHSDLKKRFFAHILQLSYDFHTTNNSGKVISKLTRGGSAIEDLSDSIINSIFPLLVQFLLVLGSLFLLHWSLLVSVFTTIVVFLIFSFYLDSKQVSLREKWSDAIDAEDMCITDTVTNIETVKYFAKEEQQVNKFDKLITKTKKLFLDYWSYFAVFQSGQQIIISFATLIILYLSYVQYLAGNFNISDIVFAQTVFFTLISPLYRFTWYMKNFWRALTDFNGICDYLNMKQSVVDQTQKKLVLTKGEIVFDNVSFSYHTRSAIEQISFQIRKAKKIALVGHSGSGKSTIVKLLCRFYDVSSGKILIDKQDISQVTQHSLRSQISIVAQEGVLFDDTIKNNILFVRPEATDAEYEHAITSAKLYDFIQRLEKKDDTIVGSRGVRLSGGERQRVSIARAILANRPILILDEATAALDSATEHDIQQALKQLLAKKTAVIVAHRLSTIMSADLILVLDKGRIIESGSHKQLYEKKGIYRRMWQLQKDGFIADQ